ncbi:hypothetical protein SPFM14_00116 [Salmonella phage SPFM14]|nr:hypothetical protein SPFM14_00116 [Salmonella phage SPFM14]
MSRTLAIPEHERVDITNGQPVYSRPVEKTLSYNRNYLFFRTYHAVHEFGWPSYVDDNSKVVLMFLRIMEALGVDTFIRKSFFYPDTVEGNLSRACDKTFAEPWAAAACVHDLFYQKRSSVGFVTDLASIPEALRPILHPDGMVALAGVHPDTPLWVTVPRGDFHFEFTLRSLYREQTGMDAVSMEALKYKLLEKPWFILTD